MNSSMWTSGKWAIVVGLLTAIALLLTSGDIGLTWDEPTYFAASESYTAWMTRLIIGPHGVLNQGVVNQAWDIDHKNPPLDKEVSGLVWDVARHLVDEILAHRLANILLASLAVALLFQMMTLELGQIAGWTTVAALLTMPRFFFHAHLAALDVPAASMIVIATYFFWRTKESARFQNTLFLGILWGLAVATGINALLVIPTLFLWVLLFRRKWYLFLRLIVATGIGLPVFFLLWPWLYYDTVARLKDVLKAIVSRPIPEYYLHQNLMHIPWTFPFVMVVAVVPLGILLLFLLGILRTLIRRRDRAFGSVLILSVLLPLVVLASGKINVFDNDRMLIPAFPFLAALAGVGFAGFVKLLSALVQRFQIPRLLIPLLSVAAAGLIFIPPLLSMVSYYPYWLSYYSESVGGLPGAQRLGLETTYWSESYREAVAYINDHAKPGDSIWVLPSSMDVLVYYQIHGILRKDVVLASLNPIETIIGPAAQFAQTQKDFNQANFVIIQYRQSFLYDSSNQPTDVLQWTSARQPAFRVERQGIPILDVYTNP